MLRRDRYVVDRCTHRIAAIHARPRETEYAVDYARRKGLEIILLDPDEG